tara:strand:+ start:115 stop:315 length:201 start_codon:yes stop_codon:yes gene_type:complete
MKRKEIDLGHGLYKYVYDKSIIEELGKSINASHPTKRKPITKEQTLKGPDKKVWHFFKGEKWEWKI